MMRNYSKGAPPVDTRLYESACHEGNYSLPMTLAGARKEEQEATNTKQ